MPTINTTRALRIENESGISGARAETVDNAQQPDQVISAASEEQTALAGFLDHQLKAMALICDQDAYVQFLGNRWIVVQTLAGAPDTIDVTGDCTDEIAGGDLVRLEGTVANDGVWAVAQAVFGAPAAATDTRITLEAGNRIGAAGGAVGTCGRVALVQRMGYSYPLTSSLVNGQCAVAWDVSDKIAAGDWVLIQNTAGNDGFFVVDTVTVLAGVTTITVNGGVLQGAEGAVGYIVKCRDKVHLTANEPFLWDEQSGQHNPFIWNGGAGALAPAFVDLLRGDVAYSMVENLHATVNANYDARYATDVDIH